MLTNLQIELIKSFEYSVPDDQILEIKELLSKYFLNKVDSEMDKLTKENQWTEQTFHEWTNV